MIDTTPEARLARLGLALPASVAPEANYIGYRIAGGLLYVSGHDPWTADGMLCTGTVGLDVTTAEAYVHARNLALGLLATARSAVGALGRLEAVKLLGMVNCVAGYTDHHAVIDGCSDLFVDVLGERGRHVRSTAGMGSLPGHITLEIEAIFKIHP
jgi:enamine deaminase RidA (YjgF/YER057c/UK114 family)